ncbi:hypothetical protein CHL67_06970 [Prosthecochloris sp. GSB1]|uniref:SRPBCC family protein n=1 Tax=Prosthecochloris sp. GSB1 TaxID=281093 RepID=UPI000B8CCD06|nr:SRPBCC family protein [Prosthecochloris sp. GSB1]ASQ90701.1 hypothetical protein CHL67_06970 [Prosthecochloris sp. GSB1]
MPFRVAITVNRSLDTPAPFDRVFGLLADVARSGSFFPKVEALTQLGGGRWKWEMERIGVGNHTLQQSVYACCYVPDRDKGTIVWTPVNGIGNAVVEGSWTVKPQHNGCNAVLFSKGSLEVNLPAFLEFLLIPIIRMEFERLVDQYVSNIERELSLPGNR